LDAQGQGVNIYINANASKSLLIIPDTHRIYINGKVNLSEKSLNILKESNF